VFLYTGEPGALWKSMEANGLEIPVASEKLCMSLRELVCQFADFQCIGDFRLGNLVTKKNSNGQSGKSCFKP